MFHCKTITLDDKKIIYHESPDINLHQHHYIFIEITVSYKNWLQGEHILIGLSINK